MSHQEYMTSIGREKKGIFIFFLLENVFCIPLCLNSELWLVQQTLLSYLVKG